MAKGVRIDDRKLREVEATLARVAGQRVKVGVLQSGSAGQQVDGAEITMAELAAIHEYGAPKANIPERSFIRRTFGEQDGREAAKKFIAKQAKLIVKKQIEPEEALERIGQWGVAAVRARVREGIAPALRPATIAAKGSSLPLVDTGGLMEALSYEVAEAKEGGE